MPTPAFDNYVICDQSGFKIKLSQCRMQWNNLLVRKDFYDPKHPLLMIRPIRETTRVQVARPGGADIFVDPQSINPLISQ